MPQLPLMPPLSGAQEAETPSYEKLSTFYHAVIHLLAKDHIVWLESENDNRRVVMSADLVVPVMAVEPHKWGKQTS